MTRTFTRRDLLGGAAASAVALTHGDAASAAPSHRLTVGAFELAIVSDGHLVLPTSFLAPDAPAAERTALLAESGETGAEFHSPTNHALIRAGNELILVDTGSGPHFMPSAGKLADNLAAAGIDRDAITTVVYTHGHPDHLWGLADEFEDVVFPKARHVVAAAEWDFWHGASAPASSPARAAATHTSRTRYAW